MSKDKTIPEPSEAAHEAETGIPSDDAWNTAIDILSNYAMRYANAKTQFDIDTAIFWASVRINEAMDRATGSAPSAPGHTDLMVSPESIDAFLEANPLPLEPSEAEVEAAAKAVAREPKQDCGSTTVPCIAAEKCTCFVVARAALRAAARVRKVQSNG